jgi:hypothetical protein
MAGKPSDRSTILPDEIIAKAWSSVQPPDIIRWATPRFVKYGQVLRREDDSMLVKFWDEPTPRGIPHAKWYYVRGKMDPQGEEHMVVVKEMPGADEKPFIPPADNAHDVWISVQAACEMLNMDGKQLRRYIRRGVVTAHKKDDRWVINRERLRDTASKLGWL